ncbi:MAG: LptF/LptG family permease [Verrucomicrobia bacterium]|nr:LptF/LptG family permease [Verrucomicrobiota bacterium]MCH8514449.1 LptF/LptG family permease [Kiritimatiellia bacterium]
MRTLHRFVLVDFLMSFGMALAVSTLMLYLGAIMRGLDFIARGVPGMVLLRIFTLNIPYILTWSIPVSALVATLLLFGRISMDGEFTAMRSGGLGTWQIISPVVFACLGLSLICLVIHYEIAPESRFARQNALRDIGELDPLDLLDEGRFVRFPGMEIYVTRKVGNRIYDVEIAELNQHREIIRTIRAESGEINTDTDLKLMDVILHNMQVQYPDPDNPTDLTLARVIDMEEYEFVLDYGQDDQEIRRNLKDMRARELMSAIRDVDTYFPNLDPRRREAQRMRAIIEAHKRIGLSMACLSFTILGIPLGMKSHRRESNIGIPIGLSMVVVFYAFIVTADSLTARPWLYPDFIIWIPVILSQIGGIILIRRIP